MSELYFDAGVTGLPDDASVSAAYDMAAVYGAALVDGGNNFDLSDGAHFRACQDVADQPGFQIGVVSLADLPADEWSGMSSLELLMTAEAQKMSFEDFRTFLALGQSSLI